MIHVVHYLRRPGRGFYSIERLYEDVRAHMPSDINVSICVSRFHTRGLVGRVYDMMHAFYYQGDVNHVTGDVHFLTYLLNQRRTILTIHDCVSLERLRGIKRWLFWLLWYWLPEKRSTAITVVSEATRQQLLQHLRCDPYKVKVIPNNVSGEFKPAPQPFNTRCPRLLHIGVTVNKNLERLAVALAGLSCKLVIVGQLSDAQIRALRRQGISYENYFGLSRGALVEQYQRCDMVVLASTYEGFGLPIIEANAVGRPVVTSNIWSMPEVAGDAACLVDPFDVASIRAGILRVVDNADYRGYLVKRGFENVRRFRIETVAEKYAEVYREVHARSNSLRR